MTSSPPYLVEGGDSKDYSLGFLLGNYHCWYAVCFQPRTKAAGLPVSRIIPFTSMDIKLSTVRD
ncbi:MAG: hypothetical protein HUM72_10370 [Dolichospermum sp.]|nr:hypothetical protein [Dolichospermum sp.]